MTKTIYLAGGCFWGVQAYFQQLKGVNNTTVGYANGNIAFPRYEDLKSGRASHAEAVKIDYEDGIISLPELLEHFLRFVDPYTLGRQGNDVGHQYRSGVYYADLLDGVEAESYFSHALKPGYRIEIAKMLNFFPAEEYHQDYLAKHPDGYCHVNLGLIRDDERK